MVGGGVKEDFPHKKSKDQNFPEKNIQERLNSIVRFVLYANNKTESYRK